MKNKTEQEKLAEFLTQNPASTKKQITEATGIKGIQLVNLLKKLKGLTSEGEGAETTYTLQPVVEGEPKAPGEESTPSGTEEEAPKAKAVKKGRDNTKFKFNGEEYPKGQLVRAVVSHYAKENPKITFKQLKEIFPDTLLHRFGIFQEVEEARKISGARDRYFFKDEHVIKLKDKTVAVCTQFTADNIKPFLAVVKGIGYKVK